jgi:hypothetical protein
MGTATAIAINVMVVIIPNHAAATTDAVLPAVNSDTAVWARCRPCRIGGPIGGVVVDDDAVVADAPAAPPLPPTDATDLMAVTMMKTHNGTVSAAAMVMAMAKAMAAATEEEEYKGWEGANPRCRLDNALLRLQTGSSSA